MQVENNTTIPVGLYVDGTWFGTYPAGASPEVILGAGLDPPLEIELRSPSDTVLAELEVSAEQLEEARMGGLAGAESVALPCGVVSIVVGTLPEDGPLAPTVSVAPGACP